MSNISTSKDLGESRHVCILAYDGLCTFEYSLAVEIFALPRPEIQHWYTYETVAVDSGSIRGAGNIVVEGASNIAALENADIIIVPGWRGEKEPVPNELKNALHAAHERGARIASICSGVFVLAQCGLLNGKKATTHWRYTESLRKQFPLIRVDQKVLYIDEGKVLTSAGSAAGLDLCLHIVRSDLGAKTANEVARRLVVPAFRDGGQAQFVARPIPTAFYGNIAPLLDVIRESLDEEWEIDRIAKAANTSARTLQRRFKLATGHSPHMWLTNERIELAKDLLETTNLNIQQIADVTGLKTPETFRHHFKRLTGDSPTRFRRKFNPYRDGSTS